MGRVHPHLSVVPELPGHDDVEGTDHAGDDHVEGDDRGGGSGGGDGPALVVAEVFGPTFQGEGPSLGRRASFVRLGRCNLDCRWCDTPYTWDWQRYDPATELHRTAVDAIVARLVEADPEIVVVTGGEPLLQQRRLVPLLEACARHGWPVEIETNGTLAPDAAVVPLVARWNVSPKLANSGVAHERRVRPEPLRALLETGRAAFKFVVAAEADLDEVADIVEAHDLHPVWIMPEGTDATTVLDRARRLSEPTLARGWNLTTRLHVLLWGDERGR
jgi:7-carboxy-7-deazaguanine synthase